MARCARSVGGWSINRRVRRGVRRPPPPPPPPPWPVRPTRRRRVSTFPGLRGLAVAMYVLLSIAALLAVIQIPVALHARSVVHDNASGNMVLVDHHVYDAVTGVSAIVGLLALVSISIMVLFIIWMWRAACNVKLFGRIRPKFAAGSRSAVGSFRSRTSSFPACRRSTSGRVPGRASRPASVRAVRGSSSCGG